MTLLSRFLCILLLAFTFITYTNAGLRAGEKNVTPITMTILGDSLMAGYGLAEEDSYPSQLQDAFDQSDWNVEIINAGVSGDTSKGGLERLAWTLAEPTDILVVSLGANDGLRAISPEFTRKNLEEIILQARELQPDINIMLLGMLAPPNLGEEYSSVFNPIYPELAAQYDIPLYPFFLDGVILDPELNQDDGIHPNAKGVKVLINKTLPFFVEYLEDRLSVTDQD